jgi:ABC-type Fe3+/spermidine/putrescine transport system ATPase subunit
MSRVTVRDLCKRFPGSMGADQVSFDIPSGNFLTLLGPSGSGKTTTLMMIAGFLEPDSGTIEVAGRDIARLAPNKRNLGVVFQSYALFPHKTVWENVAFPLKIRKMPNDEIDRRVAKMLDLVRLDSFKDRSVTVLSGGQKQRVALARALVFEPPVLLMDEPLGALDRKLREHMQVEIKNIQRSLNVTAIYVTHDQDEALSMSDTIAIMNEGRIAQIGSPEDLYERPTSRFVAEFLGGINLLPVAGVSSDAGAHMADLGLGARVPCSAPSAGQGGPFRLGVRPERVLIGNPGTGHFDATVTKRTYLGGAVLYDLAFHGIELAAKTATGGAAPMSDVGSTVSVSWPAHNAWLLA